MGFVPGDTAAGSAVRAFVPDENDIIIENDTVYENQNLSFNHNLSVKKGAELVVRNTTIMVDAYNFYRWIWVEPEAKLSLINSTISLLREDNREQDYGYFIAVNGELRMSRSEIHWAGSLKNVDIYDVEAGGIEITGGSAHIEDSLLKQNDVFRVIGSTLVAVNTTFTMGYVALELDNSKAEITDCNFSGGLGINILNTKSYRIHNSTFRGSQNEYKTVFNKAINIENSGGRIENCSFDTLATGISISEYPQGVKIEGITVGYGNSHFITNCTFDYVGGYYGTYVIASFGGKIYLDNISITYPALEVYSYFYNSNALNLQFSTAYINDLRLNHFFTGAGFYHSDVVMTNSIINDSYNGLDLSMLADDDEIGFTADNITLTGNEYGMVVDSYNVNIKNSVIDSNTIGIESEDGVIALENNFIFNHSGWGIVATGTEVGFTGENFRAPQGWAGGGSLNGMGNLLQLRKIDVYVKTDDDRPLAMFIVNVSNQNLHLIKREHGFNYDYERNTDHNGFAHLGKFIEYLILEGAEKIMVNDYTLTASYSTQPDFIYKNVTNIKLNEVQGDNLTIRIALPNVYIVQEELVLDPEEVKPGRTVTIRTTVHYTGPSDLVVPDFNASLYVSNTLIQVIRVEGLSTANPTQDVVFNWKAEGGGVAMPNNVIRRIVKIKLEPPEGLEYTYSSTEYTDDNTVSAFVGLKIDFEQDKIWISGGLGNAVVFCCALIIGIVLMIGGVWIIHYRRLPEEKKEEMRKRKKEKMRKKLEKKKERFEKLIGTKREVMRKRLELKVEKKKEKMEKIRQKRGGMDGKTEVRLEKIQEKMREDIAEERRESGAEAEEGSADAWKVEDNGVERAGEVEVKKLEDEDIGELELDEPPANVEITGLDEMAQLEVDEGGPPSALVSAPADAKTPPPQAIPSPEDTRIKKRRKRKH